MARPQLEDGHTDIAHELVEALCRINLTAYESRVLWALFRKTYGWHKRWDRISYTQWEEMTGIKRWHVARTIKQLIARNIITQRGNGYKLEYSFQKDYEQWKVLFHRYDLLPSGVTNKQSLPAGVESLPAGVEPLPSEVTKSLPAGVNTKEKKETIQKKRQKIGPPEKKKYGEFNNVLLSEEEYQKLKERFGEVECQRMIETLSSGMKAKPQKYKYDSHYAAILNWKRREEKEVDYGAHRGHISEGSRKTTNEQRRSGLTPRT